MCFRGKKKQKKARKNQAQPRVDQTTKEANAEPMLIREPSIEAQSTSSRRDLDTNTTNKSAFKFVATNQKKLSFADLGNLLVTPKVKPKFKDVNESDTLYGYTCSMSERLFSNTPTREDSDIERIKITGLPLRRKTQSQESKDSKDNVTPARTPI